MDKACLNAACDSSNVVMISSLSLVNINNPIIGFLSIDASFKLSSDQVILRPGALRLCPSTVFAPGPCALRLSLFNVFAPGSRALRLSLFLCVAYNLAPEYPEKIYIKAMKVTKIASVPSASMKSL